MNDIRIKARHNGKVYDVAKLDMWGDFEQATCDLARLDEELFDAMGTVKEIADKLKIKPATVKFYGYEAYKKRRVNKDTMRVLVEIEMDGVE